MSNRYTGRAGLIVAILNFAPAQLRRMRRRNRSAGTFIRAEGRFSEVILKNRLRTSGLSKRWFGPGRRI